MRPGRWWRREGLGGDAVAGLVLGVESVPDGLAAGLLAGVNPVAGLHAYLFGTIGGALFTSSTFLAVQATGAMSIIVADVPAVHEAPDPAAALFTLSFLTGAVMVVAGVARMGAVLRFVSHSVVVGFVSAVGVNIILGQLGNFTGYDADGSSRLARAFDTLTHPGRLDGATLAVGTATILLILALERTRLGPLGLVVAVVATSGAAALVGATGVAVLADLTTVPGSLPLPQLPTLRLIPSLVVPALSLAFVGLVQGAAISASVPNPDGASPDASRDFIGQGVGNLVSGAFQGMPVGGSMSGSRLNRSAGARSRLALVLASVVMAVVILLFSAPVGHIAMPALAALLMLIGYRTVKPADLESVWRTGIVQKIVLVTTFALTMLIPLQYAVLAGVGLSVVLHVVRQSHQITIKQWRFDEHGQLLEGEPPAELPHDGVVILQCYGSLFFASAPVVEARLPAATDASRNSVVLLRVRGRTDLGTTFMDLLVRYARSLAAHSCKLVIVSAGERVREQLIVTGVTDEIGPENVYASEERLGAALRHAHRDAERWVERNASETGTEP